MNIEIVRFYKKFHSQRLTYIKFKGKGYSYGQVRDILHAAGVMGKPGRKYQTEKDEVDNSHDFKLIDEIDYSPYV